MTPRHSQTSPPSPGHHSTIIVVVFISFGALFFLAFLSAALCCCIKKKKKGRVQKTEILNSEEHTKVQEANILGPHGQQVTVLPIEEDANTKEEITNESKEATK